MLSISRQNRHRFKSITSGKPITSGKCPFSQALGATDALTRENRCQTAAPHQGWTSTRTQCRQYGPHSWQKSYTYPWKILWATQLGEPIAQKDAEPLQDVFCGSDWRGAYGDPGVPRA